MPLATAFNVESADVMANPNSKTVHPHPHPMQSMEIRAVGVATAPDMPSMFPPSYDQAMDRDGAPGGNLKAPRKPPR